MISIIIPTYNRSTELPRAIESVINQTFQDWELIIVDDGSSDNTADVIKTFQKRYKNIHYYYFTNMGASVARNIGIGLSKGELIAFLDSDDIWTEGRLQAIYETHVTNHRTIKMYLTDFRSHTSSGSLFDNDLVKSARFKQSLYAINFLGGTINMVIPRKILMQVGGFDTDLDSVEDHDLYIRLVDSCEVKYIPGEFAIYYLDSSDRISGKNSKRLSGQLDFYKKHRREMSLLSRLLVMKKNALIAFYNRSPVIFKYLHAWIIIWVIKKLSGIQNDLDLFKISTPFLCYISTRKRIIFSNL